MKVINSQLTYDLTRGVYIALGSFDGLHKGHLSLLSEVKRLAKENDGISAVFTFSKHPLEEICPEKAPKLIMENSYKLNILEKENIDIVIMKDFNEKFMKQHPEDFIKMLLNEFNVKGIVVGFNNKFGYKNSGDVELLEQLQSRYGYKLSVLKPKTYKDKVISSTRIRNSICLGNVAEARDMLARPYSLEGEVVHGKKLGRTIGFPTANIEVSKKLVIPKKGVYYTNVLYNNKIYRAITSVGNNPTVNGDTLTIEPFILDFNKNIYGEKIRIFFLQYMRDEKKFDSIDALVEQLKYDANCASDKEILT